MTNVVDFHVHVFANPFESLFSKIPGGQWVDQLTRERVKELRKRAREWIRPFSDSLHQIQSIFRHLPEFTQKGLDEIGSLVPLPNLLIESTPTDLIDAMGEAGVQYALLIAHPPFVTNEFILNLCKEYPQFIPAINIPKETKKPGILLKKYTKQGAKVLKIHPSMDGGGIQSSRYRALIGTATDLGIPIVIHSGCIHKRLIFKNLEQAKAECFARWYQTYRDTQFILAHMNYQNPEVALDVCEEFANVRVDTSWQPAEVISEAARRLGADRVLFGTDWPMMGHNLWVGRKRIDDCLASGMLNENQAKLILGENATKLLGLSKDAQRFN